MLEQVNIDGEWREAETEVVARLDLLMARVAELEGILKGHVIVAGETKAMQSALEKCLEVEAILPPATVRLVKDTLAMRQKALKALGIQ